MEIRLPQFPVEGGCVCGAIRYRVSAPPTSLYACHCKDCQRYSGAGYSMAMSVNVADFAVIKGEAARFGKRADSGRTPGVRFCAVCATRLWQEPEHSPHLVIVVPGTLDDSSWIRPTAHIWADHRLPFAEIPADAAVIDGQPVDRQPIFDSFAKALRRP